MSNSVATPKHSIGDYLLQGLKWLGWGLMTLICHTAAFVTTFGLSGALFFALGAAIAAIIGIFIVVNPMTVLIWLILASVITGAALTYGIVKNEGENFSELLNKLQPKPLDGPSPNAVGSQNSPSEIDIASETETEAIIKPTFKEIILKILLDFLIALGVEVLVIIIFVSFIGIIVAACFMIANGGSCPSFSFNMGTTSVIHEITKCDAGNADSSRRHKYKSPANNEPASQ